MWEWEKKWKRNKKEWKKLSNRLVWTYNSSVHSEEYGKPNSIYVSISVYPLIHLPIYPLSIYYLTIYVLSNYLPIYLSSIQRHGHFHFQIGAQNGVTECSWWRDCSRLNFIYPGLLGDSFSNSNSLTRVYVSFKRKEKTKKKEGIQTNRLQEPLSIIDIIKIIE